MRKKRTLIPTDEEIERLDNVPIPIAAAYLGKSSSTISYALQDKVAPYGYASESREDDSGRKFYNYHISPGLLIAYKRGTLPIFPIGKLMETLVAELKRELKQVISMKSS